MIQANIREAKAKLSAYLSQVEQGEEILILRRGKPVAVLRPVEEPAPLPSLKDFRKNIRIEGLSASETIISMREDSRY
jgi:prevent-host-death family protein